MRQGDPAGRQPRVSSRNAARDAGPCPVRRAGWFQGGRCPHAPDRACEVELAGRRLRTMPWKYPPGLVRKCSAGFAQTMAIPGWQPRLRVDLVYPRLDPGQVGVVVGYHRFQLRKLGVDALTAQLGYLFLGHAAYG